MRFSSVLTLILIAFAQTPALRIVVLEGEDAVNIVQQKTAVRPLIEVRDRNNAPVAGATVTFTIGGGQPAAFAGGVQTLTVTTNAAGQAAASGFNVLGPGAVQLQVQAAYQGQIATAAISQTNFATAAAASQASAASSGAGGSSSGAAGGAAGGGGGISGTTIGIVGAAVAGGAVAATQLTKECPDCGPGVDGAPLKTYTAQFSGSMTSTVNFSNGLNTGTCVQQKSVMGTVKMVFGQEGNAEFSVNAPIVSTTGGQAACPSNFNPGNGGSTKVTQANPSFRVVLSSGGSTQTPLAQTFEFSGTQNGDTITGTFTYTETFGSPNSGGGTVSFNITLRQ